ncbi:MAG: outer membrane protein assembly factor BamE [Gammaproteobacteria bacterium]|nr:outer membrane protein assembly factor BamE [Gammaproteobacteria bacterium]
MPIQRQSKWTAQGPLTVLKNHSMRVAILAFGLLLSGCVYKMDIQQGNEITPEMVAQLEIGMTKREVTRVAGTPLIADPFHNNRWDYYHSILDGKTGKVASQKISLWFTGDVLSAINQE